MDCDRVDVPPYTSTDIKEFEFKPGPTTAEIVYVPEDTLEATMDADVMPGNGYGYPASYGPTVTGVLLNIPWYDVYAEK